MLEGWNQANPCFLHNFHFYKYDIFVILYICGCVYYVYIYMYTVFFARADLVRDLRPLALPCCSNDYGGAKSGEKRISLRKVEI